MIDFSTPLWRISTHLHSDDVGKPAIEWKAISTLYEGDNEEEAMKTLWDEIVFAEEPMLIYIDKYGDRIQMVEVI
jgi:hypothetical protein